MGSLGGEALGAEQFADFPKFGGPDFAKKNIKKSLKSEVANGKIMFVCFFWCN